MTRLKNIIALCLCMLSTSVYAAPAFDIRPIDYFNTPGWTIGISQNHNSCVSKAEFKDNTSLWIGWTFLEGEVYFYIAFLNAAWKPKPDVFYDATLFLNDLGRKYTANSVGSSEPEPGISILFSMNLASEFLSYFASARSIALKIGDKELVHLSLKGSRKAVDALITCQEHLNIVHDEKKQQNTQNEPNITTGTGFFVHSAGYVLTNSHVAGHCKALSVFTADGAEHNAVLFGNDENRDLAVIKTPVLVNTVAEFAEEADLGQIAYTYGYPYPGMLANDGTFTSGSVNALAGLGNDSSQLQISVPIQPGNSGGALLNDSGDVIGIVSSKLNVQEVAKVTNDYAQNVNFAIKNREAMQFLISKGIAPIEAQKEKESLPTVQIAKKAKDFTVKIHCFE